MHVMCKKFIGDNILLFFTTRIGARIIYGECRGIKGEAQLTGIISRYRDLHECIRSCSLDQECIVRSLPSNLIKAVASAIVHVSKLFQLPLFLMVNRMDLVVMVARWGLGCFCRLSVT